MILRGVRTLPYRIVDTPVYLIFSGNEEARKRIKELHRMVLSDLNMTLSGFIKVTRSV